MSFAKMVAILSRGDELNRQVLFGYGWVFVSHGFMWMYLFICAWSSVLGPLLLTWISFNPSMDKWSQAL